LNRGSTASRCSTALLLLAVLGCVSCGVPLAPGYGIERERIEVHYIAGSAPHLAIRAQYLLNNLGSGRLTSVAALFPGKTPYGTQNLKVEIDGRQVSVVPASGQNAGSPSEEEVEMPFDPPWAMREKRNLLIQYDLDVPVGGEADTAHGDYFYLPSSGFPKFEEPKIVFAHNIERPVPMDFTLQVPRNFRVHAPGSLARRRDSGDQTEWHFRIGRHDPDPFVVSGAYQEEVVTASEVEVAFWTFEPIPADAVNAARIRLTATLAAYTDAFGLLSKPPLKVWIVLVRSTLGENARSTGPAWAGGFPDGLLLNEGAFSGGIQSDDFLSAAEAALAQLWIGTRVRIGPDAELVLTDGFEKYATIVAAEARGGVAGRRQDVESVLRAYDRARNEAVDEPLSQITVGDPLKQRLIAYDRAALFFVALEDTYGEAPIRRGIAHLVKALRGNTVGLSDLRAALEQETRKNMAEAFRVWLNQPGIPDDFRKRYETDLAKGNAESDR
jgi:hypothetical protein